MTILYGITNCDTVKKAKNWLDTHSIPYQFHDFRKDGITEKLVTNWVMSVGIDLLLNKRGTSWRNLDSATQLACENNPVPVLCDTPTLIKRPVLVIGKQIMVGFKPEQYQAIFKVNA